MDYRQLGGSGLKVPVLGFWNGHFWWKGGFLPRLGHNGRGRGKPLD